MKIAAKVIKWVLLSMYLIFAIFPVLWIFLTSVKPPYEVYTFPVKYLPSHISFENYKKLFTYSEFGKYFLNSVVVASLSSLISTFFAMLAGYSLSRSKEKKVYYIVLFLFFAQMIPAYLVMIPQYVMFSRFHLIDKLIGVIIVYSGIGASFSTIMARGFFARIPKELEEAAMIDGCNRWQALFKVIIPLVLPGIAAVFSFSFVNSWNEVFVASLFLNNSEKYTVPVALYSFISKAGVNWGFLSAGLVVALVPTIIIFAFAQKYIVEGLTQGATKF